MARAKWKYVILTSRTVCAVSNVNYKTSLDSARVWWHSIQTHLSFTMVKINFSSHSPWKLQIFDFFLGASAMLADNIADFQLSPASAVYCQFATVNVPVSFFDLISQFNAASYAEKIQRLDCIR